MKLHIIFLNALVLCATESATACRLGETYFKLSAETARPGFTCNTPISEIVSVNCTCTDAGTEANARGNYRQEGYLIQTNNPHGLGVDAGFYQFVNPTSGRTGTGGSCYFDWSQGGISICD